MLGRRIVVAAGLAAVIAFGGGAAIAGAHGSSHSVKKPVKTQAKKQAPGSNVHYPCRHHGIAAAQL